MGSGHLPVRVYPRICRTEASTAPRGKLSSSFSPQKDRKQTTQGRDGRTVELLESLPRGAVEASIRLMRGYTRTGKWPEPILTSPDPQRGRSPSPSDEWSDG